MVGVMDGAGDIDVVDGDGGPAMFLPASPARIPVEVPSMVPFSIVTVPVKVAGTEL